MKIEKWFFIFLVIMSTFEGELYTKIFEVLINKDIINFIKAE